MHWGTVEPILRRTYALMDGTGRTTAQAVIDDLGLSAAEARSAFDALAKSGYIAVEKWGGNGLPFFIEPSPAGLQHCAGWPAPGTAPTFVPEFLSAIEARAGSAATPEDEKGRLKRFLQAAGSVGQSALTDVAAKVIEHQAGV